MCSGSEADSYLRLIDFVYHSTLGLRVIKRESLPQRAAEEENVAGIHNILRRGSYLRLIDLCITQL